MGANTTYGTWNNHGDNSALTVEASIANATATAPCEWLERMEEAGAFTKIANKYRTMINAALPDSVCLSGNEFYGPYAPEDQDFEGYPQDKHGALDIKAIIESVDLWEIVGRYDVDNVPA